MRQASHVQALPIILREEMLQIRFGVPTENRCSFSMVFSFSMAAGEISGRLRLFIDRVTRFGHCWLPLSIVISGIPSQLQKENGKDKRASQTRLLGIRGRPKLAPKE